jgi:hypothetical protein
MIIRRVFRPLGGVPRFRYCFATRLCHTRYIVQIRNIAAVFIAEP